MKALGGLLLSILVALAGLAADAGRTGRELRFALQAEPKTFDALLASEEPSELVGYWTSGTLVRLHRVKQTIEPELATSWKASEGGKVLKLELRKGVSFSDGTPFGAVDVCYTFRRLLDPALNSPFADSFETGKGKVACSVDSESAVTLRFPVAVPSAERLLDGLPMQSSRSPKKEAAGLGPFVVGERQPGALLVLARNPNYWKRDGAGNALPYLDSVRIEILRNRETELQRFRRGEYHVIQNLDPESFDKLAADQPGAARDLGASLDSEFVWFNQVPSAALPEYKKEWFRSREFRTGISRALRRADMVKVVYHGHGAPAWGPVPPANRFWHNTALKAAPEGPKEALEWLARAGFAMKGGALRDRAGHAVEFSVITNSGNKTRERLAAMMQQDLAAIGVKLNIVPLDFPALIDRISKTFQYEACLLGLVNYDLDPNSVMNVWISSAPNHAWNPGQKQPGTAWEAELDRLMNGQASEMDLRRRKAAFDRVQEIVSEEQPFIYLVNRNALLAVSPRLEGVQPSMLRPQTLWNIEWLSLGN